MKGVCPECKKEMDVVLLKKRPDSSNPKDYCVRSHRNKGGEHCLGSYKVPERIFIIEIPS